MKQLELLTIKLHPSTTLPRFHLYNMPTRTHAKITAISLITALRQLEWKRKEAIIVKETRELYKPTKIY